MSKFSVKKPLTIFVAVIAILVLGVVAYTKMTPDLLPNMDFPYVIVVTTYPGASPEKVENEISKPLEQTMSTLEHIEEIQSTSSENYSMVLMQFEESVNMDTIGVDIQQKITALSSRWDDTVSAPYVLKINPSMLPIEVAAVAMEGKTTVELTEFLDDTLMNKLEGIPGVARISKSGSVDQELHVILDQKMIDVQNKLIADAISGKLDEAAADLESKKEELEKAQGMLGQAQYQLDKGIDQLASTTSQAEAGLDAVSAEAVSAKAALDAQIAQLNAEVNTLSGQVQDLNGVKQQIPQLASQQKKFDAEIEAIEKDDEKYPSKEDKDAAIQELKNSPEYIAMVANKSVLDVKLAVNDIHFDVNDPDGAIAGVDAALVKTEKDIEQKKSDIRTAEQTKLGLDAGIVSAAEAKATLSAQKTSGMMAMSSAMAQVAANSASLSAAMAQIDSGFASIESTREATLNGADLDGILSMDMISGILKAQNFAMPAGYVEQDGISYMVSVGDEITVLEELQNLIILDMGIDGLAPVRLCDVAEVMVTDNRGESYARLNGEHGVVLSFEKQSTYSTAGATTNINNRFRELEKEYDGLHFVALMDQGDYIYMIVDNILNSLLLGSVFAVIVLFLFLRDLRPTFITLCAIPISVVFAIVLMYFSGVTINMISLSGLAVSVGMLVDNSVVVIENIYRLRSKGANVIQAAVSGAGQVAGAVTASTLTTVCVFLPIVFVEGITRQLFTDLALTMTYSLMASLIVSLTLVPAMASGMLRKNKYEKEGGTQSKMLNVYSKVVSWSLNHKFIVLALSVIALVVTGMMSLSKGFIFMPKMDMPNANVSITMPEDCTMEEAVALADEVLTRIDTLDGLETVGAMMSGGSLLGGNSGSSHNVTVYITLADENASGAEVGRKIVEMCSDMECEVSSSSSMMDMSALTGSGISMELYGENMQQLQEAAKTAAKVLGELPGVAETSDGLEDSAPALHIAVDRNKAMSKGVTVAQVFMDLSAALSNSQTGQDLVLNGTSTDIIIERQTEKRLDVEGLKNRIIKVNGTDGSVKEIKLSDVAEVEETSSLSSIGRKSQRRFLTVTATLEDGYNVTLLTSDAIKAMENTDLGQGITYQFTGENESIMEAVKQLMLMLLLGVLLVYLVMVAQFQSLKSPFIVMFTIPLAFTGGFLALLLCGMEVSVISLIGFIMLTGIIVNNGIVLVDYINQLRQEGIARRDAIVEAGRTRMRPILMTSITTILGLIDMAVRKTAGTALMQPMAVVCIGGLLYATLMTLLVVPCIYDMLNKKELRTVREEDLQILDI